MNSSFAVEISCKLFHEFSFLFKLSIHLSHIYQMSLDNTKNQTIDILQLNVHSSDVTDFS